MGVFSLSGGLLLVAAVALCHVNHRSACPQALKPMQGFEPSKFLGEWFVLRSFDPDVSCLAFNYTSCGVGCLRVVERKQIQLIDRIGLSHVYETDGTLRTIGSGAVPAEMEASFTTNARSALYTVLATDYSSFAAVYTCQNIGLDAAPLYHRRDVYVLARDRNATLTPEHVQQVSAALEANEIEDEFEPVSHAGCVASEDATLDLNANKLGQRVSSVASKVQQGISKFASSIAGLFSGGSDPAAEGVSPLRRRRRGAHF